MSKNLITPEPFVPVPVAAIAGTFCDHDEYQRLYAESITNPDSFWSRQAACVDWMRKPSRIADWSFDPVRIRWFEDGVLNLCHNAVDRHVAAGHGERIAIIFEPDSEDGCARNISYAQLLAEVIKMASVLRKLGVRKGDRVTIHMPMIAESAVAMLACVRIGAVHSVVFGGFSPEAIRSRIQDCASDWVVCADEGLRGGKTVPLKRNIDQALERLDVKGVLVVAHTGGAVPMSPGRDHWYHLLAAETLGDCPCEPMQAEDPLFILYTSGSTGNPKGLVHTVGGYSVWTATTFRYCFDYRPQEVFWCSADADRVALTALGVTNAAELDRVQYLTNAFKTQTQGVDAVLTNVLRTDSAGTFNTSIGINYNSTKVVDRNPLIVSNDRVANHEKILPKFRVNFTVT